MTQEEKAKRYDEALERAENIYNEIAIPSATTKGICTYIFPELKESEDERIRKALIEACKQSLIVGGFHKDKVIAWLEKQGEQKSTNNQFTPEQASVLDKHRKFLEQKPADIPENFEKYVEHLLSLSDGEGHGSPAKVKEVSAELLRLAKLERNPAWSEEDESYLNTTIAYLKDAKEFKKTAENCIDWLNSLKDRYTWKPSDMELEVLRRAAEKDSICLMKLYDKLKKLREE